MATVKLHGRIFLTFHIELLSGLHIGGAASALEIGGLDKPVIRNALTNQPYIPGSSLKGKMRSLMEKAYAAPQTQRINKGVFVHTAQTLAEYQRYPVASIFGMLPEFPEQRGTTVPAPTRLTVRDVPLTPKSEQELKNLRLDLPYTEVKWEAAIDRVTSAAAPRQIERVPAGAVFGPAQLVYSVYVGDGETTAAVVSGFKYVIEALDYLEDDYLGGMGTRGNGRVQLKDLTLTARTVGEQGYAAHVDIPLNASTIQDIDKDALITALQTHFS